jgi:hypothetical protein
MWIPAISRSHQSASLVTTWRRPAPWLPAIVTCSAAQSSPPYLRAAGQGESGCAHGRKAWGGSAACECPCRQCRGSCGGHVCAQPHRLSGWPLAQLVKVTSSEEPAHTKRPSWAARRHSGSGGRVEPSTRDGGGEGVRAALLGPCGTAQAHGTRRACAERCVPASLAPIQACASVRAQAAGARALTDANARARGSQPTALHCTADRQPSPRRYTQRSTLAARPGRGGHSGLRARTSTSRPLYRSASLRRPLLDQEVSSEYSAACSPLLLMVARSPPTAAQCARAADQVLRTCAGHHTVAQHQPPEFTPASAQAY